MKDNKIKPLVLIFFITAFAVRFVHLNYNSPFNDEAVYALVGQLGINYGDWQSMTPFKWLGGIPYFYPLISGFFYNLGGIYLVRLVNVFLFMISLFIIHKILILLTEDKVNAFFSLIPLIIFGFSSTGYYVSRLATYDMPSFTAFIISIYFLIIGLKNEPNFGNYFFFSSIFIILSFYLKYITLIFIPLIICFSYLLLKNNKQKRLWLIYFFVPILLSIIGLLVIKYTDLQTFYSTQVGEIEKYSAIDVLNLFYNEISHNLELFLIGSIGFFITGKIKLWAMIFSLPVVILTAHLYTSRMPTLDKHLLYVVFAFSLIAGLGINFLYQSIQNNRDQYDFKIIIIILLAANSIFSMHKYTRYNQMWTNTDQVLDQSVKIIDDNEIVLTNLGAPAQLGLVKKTYPTNVFTFDWVYYDGFTDIEAIEKGVDEGYFKTLIFENQKPWMTNKNIQRRKIALNNLDGIYFLAWENNDYQIYKRSY